MYESLHLKVWGQYTLYPTGAGFVESFLENQIIQIIACSRGVGFRNISVQVYDSNPYSTGTTGPGDKVLKVTICGLPLSVDDSAVFEMLDKFEINRKSEMKYENIRHPITHRMTNVLNGYRFLYIE